MSSCGESRDFDRNGRGQRQSPSSASRHAERGRSSRQPKRQPATKTAVLGDDGWEIPIFAGRIAQSSPADLRLPQRALPFDTARHSATPAPLRRGPLPPLRSAQQIGLPRASRIPLLGPRESDCRPAVESFRESDIARSPNLRFSLVALSHPSGRIGRLLEDNGIGFPFTRVENALFSRREDDAGVPISRRPDRQTIFHLAIDPVQRFLLPHLFHGRHQHGGGQSSDDPP